jgi:signal transduction histidine kinase/ligand-binding sensor domain-containing protein/DNA-binding response OmpR family regulator
MLKKTYAGIVSILLVAPTFAYNLQQLSSKDGLSNSAIQAIVQDRERLMWFGSCDGLNMYDGRNIRVYKPTPNNPTSLSGNLIEGIMEAEDNILWIATNHGFNRLDKKRRLIEYHDEFRGKYHWAKTAANDIFAIRQDNAISYYDTAQKVFRDIPFAGVVNEQIRHFFIDPCNTMWILSDNGQVTTVAIRLSNSNLPTDAYKLQIVSVLCEDVPISYIFNEKDRIYYVDAQCRLYEYSVATRKKKFIHSLRREVQEGGDISSIIRDNDDYLIAFKTNGLIRLRRAPGQSASYQTERVDIYCGVFALYKDELQDIIWIGTDGQGVYMYHRGSSSLRAATFIDLPFRIQKPVRALLLDDFSTLWVGSKGDGVLAIHDFRAGGDLNVKKIERYTTGNSALANNTVYAFAKSKRNLLWIGSDGPGLSYYSYREKKIKQVPSHSHEEIVYVHSIHEVCDSVLWAATVGSGILKIILTGTDDDPQIKSVKRTTFVKDELSYNYFFSAYRENDSLLWFGNRGYGIQRLNIRTETFEHLNFYKKDIKTINDILSIHKDRNGNMWFGTSYGVVRLVRYSRDSAAYENYNEIEGLPNNTIHGILEDRRGHLWLSTNNGIAQFHPETKKFRIYNHINGLAVIEFSDGAYYHDAKTGMLLFGGTNGFVCITQDDFADQAFMPPVSFTGLTIDETEYNLSDFMRRKKDGEYLELKYEQNFFSISFIALDYINGQHYRYFYNLENFNDKWMDKGSSNVVTFTKVPPGEYVLHVKYENGASLTQNDIYSLKIVILPPWRLTVWAYLLYALLGLALFCCAIFLIRKSYKRKRTVMIEKLNQRQKEEIYESKLRFFTNITHEFCAPLTLIYGPCARILSCQGDDALVKKYALLIMRNTERLNALIQELIEFRRIETGHKACIVEPLALSELAKSIAESFSDLSETRGIGYQIRIEDDVQWNSDKSCFTKILTNLLSNAFKYAPDGGKVEVSIRRIRQALQILVTNTGKGIKEKDIPFIFDRYTVLENFEKQTQKGLSSRHGLGLAICHSMVKLLHGEIDVQSAPGEQTCFTVTLPHVAPTTPENREAYDENMPSLPTFADDLPVAEPENYAFVKTRPTILVIDDDPEMLWFISEIFKERYNIIPVRRPEAVHDVLLQAQPHLIISDIMMPQVDGVTLMKQIKADKRTVHIPFILLSAKNTVEEQVEGIEAGAEMYLTKPFNVEYLKSIVDRLLQRQDDLKGYYGSAISSFELADGKYLHKEERLFLDKLIHEIDAHFSDPDFSTAQLSSSLGLSTRHLYRRLKKIIPQTPADLIKEYRLSIAEKLLITTQLSIDEIMYRAGFVNRGNFYHAFSQKFGMTPKIYRRSKQKDAAVAFSSDCSEA